MERTKQISRNKSRGGARRYNTKSKMPTTSTKRSDGIRSNLYNPIPNVIGDLAVVEKLRMGIKNFPSVQLHSALPASNDVCKVSCKFGDVPKGSMLSYQQRVKLSNKPKVHINIEAPDPPSFTLPPVNQTYSTVLTMSAAFHRWLKTFSWSGKFV